MNINSSGKTTTAKFFSCLSLLLTDVQLECLLGLFPIACGNKIVLYKTCHFMVATIIKKCFQDRTSLFSKMKIKNDMYTKPPKSMSEGNHSEVFHRELGFLLH